MDAKKCFVALDSDNIVRIAIVDDIVNDTEINDLMRDGYERGYQVGRVSLDKREVTIGKPLQTLEVAQE